VRLEVISETDALLIRRLVLEPGEAMYWHTDLCRRFTVVVQGSRLAIEYADGAAMEVAVHPGLADWDEPDPRLHRAVNLGAEPFEEVVTFFLARPGQEPQPRGAPDAAAGSD